MTPQEVQDFFETIDMIIEWEDRVGFWKRPVPQVVIDEFSQA